MYKLQKQKGKKNEIFDAVLKKKKKKEARKRKKKEKETKGWRE